MFLKVQRTYPAAPAHSLPVATRSETSLGPSGGRLGPRKGPGLGAWGLGRCQAEACVTTELPGSLTAGWGPWGWAQWTGMFSRG